MYNYSGKPGRESPFMFLPRIADEGHVIEKGNIIASGTHKDLLDSSEIYKGFYKKQLHKEDEISL